MQFIVCLLHWLFTLFSKGLAGAVTKHRFAPSAVQWTGRDLHRVQCSRSAWGCTENGKEVKPLSIDEMRTFFDRSLRGLVRGDVVVGGRQYEYRQWDGEELDSKLISVDTETELAEPGKIPRLAVAQAFDVETCHLIHPDELGRFIRTHAKCNFVGHNIAGFDFHVIFQHLGRTDRKARKAWLKVADDGRLADTMLLDQLCRLGFGTFPRERHLGEVAASWAKVDDLDKNDPWRLRYGEIIGVDWAAVDLDAWDYAAKDPIATRLAFIPLRDRARELAARNGVETDTIQRYGLLSQRLQIRAAIALAAVSHRGIGIDTSHREETERRLRNEMRRLLTQLDEMPDLAGVFRRDKHGNLTFTPTGKPRIAQKRLRQVLEKLAGDHDIVPNRSDKTGVLSLSRQFWSQHDDIAPFITTWVRLEEVAKLIQFFAKLQTDRVHPRYTTIVRTGRTSSSKPNIQQIPRNEGFREIFVPRPGFVFLTIDYAALELRTLAAECERRFGESVLADVIRSGTDPHENTASLLLGMNLGEFRAQRKSEPKQFKLERQRAKAVNFGVPGGLGPKSLSAYAKLTYGVDLSEDEAADFRDRFLYEIYPEIGQYMESDAAGILAENLRVKVREVRKAWPDTGLLGGAKNVVQGRTKKRDGSAYAERFVDDVWRKLRRLNENPDLDEYLDHERAGPELEKILFFGTVTTITGRPRGRATFTQRKNTPFQAAAADGCKIALWKLFRAGYKVVAFVHDEFVIELPENCDFTQEAIRIDQICCRSMEQVTGDVPIECEYAVSYCWSKDAEAVWDNDGRLVPWGDEAARTHQCKSVPSATPIEATANSKPPEQTAAKARLVSPNHQLESPQTDVFVGDCRDLLPTLTVQPNLIFADPPFNIGEHYGTWNDNMSWPEYVDFTYEWINACLDVLTANGSFWIHVPDEIAAEIVVHVKDRGLEMINWCLWHYRFGQCRNTNFIRSKEHGLYFARDRKERTWNPDAVRVQSDRATKYNDKRTRETRTPGMRVPLDVWGLPNDGKYWGRVQGNNKERRPNHENQLPELYLARIIKATSNEGDLVLDPFAGSGTTGTVARALQRRSVGIEIDSNNAVSAFERIENGPIRDVVTNAYQIEA